MDAGKYLYVLSGLLLSGSPIAVAAEPSRQPETVATLSGEQCTIEHVPMSNLPSAVQVEAIVRCGERQVGSAVSMQAAGREAAPSEQELNRLRLYLAPEIRFECEPAKPLPQTDGAVVFACRQRADGFPAMVIVRWSTGTRKLAAASGPASAYPALRAAAGLPPVQGTVAELKTQLSGLWGQPVVIASAGDQALIQSLRDQARLANGRFAFAAAETALRKALDLQLALFGERDVVAATILTDVAVVVANQRRFDEADRLLQRAGPIIELSPRASDRARLAGYQANVAWIQGDKARALDAARSATAQWRVIAASSADTSEADVNPLSEPLAPGELAMALNREAGFLLEGEDPAGASARASEALTLLEKSPSAPRWWKADVLGNLAASSIALGRLSAAEAYFKAAIDLRKQSFGEDPATLRMRVALARAYQSEGLHTSAIVTYREALAIARGLPREAVPFTAEDLAPFAAAVVDYGAGLDDPKALQGLYAEAFDAFQLAVAPGRDRTVALATQRLAAGTPELAEMLRRIADDESARGQARDALAAEQALPADEQDPARAEARRKDLAAIDDRLAAARKALSRDHPDYEALLAPPLPKLDVVRARLGESEALVTYLIGRKESFVQLVKRSGITIARVPAGEADLRETVQTLRQGLEIEGKSVADFDIEASHRLFGQVLAPVERELAGVKRLVVVPAGALASLPFEVLVTRAGKPGDYAGSRWLVQDLAISHSPSLSSFISLRSTRLTGKQPKLMLAVADPVLGPATPPVVRKDAGTAPQMLPSGFAACRSDGPVLAEVLRSLPSLPDTLREISSVTRALGKGTTLLTGSRAGEEQLRAQPLGDYRILYFATHGVIPGELKCQGEPGLVLTPPALAATQRSTDGMLDASEIAALDLHADLVVLSACNTAGQGNGKALGGETLSGLALAFFHAGARNLVVSHWQVPSSATARLMTDAFAAMSARKDTSIDEALRHAQIGAIGDRQSAHPFFWGAFVVLGDGAAMPLQERTGS